MLQRKTMRRHKDKIVFARTAKKTKRVNIAPTVSRGGIRL